MRLSPACALQWPFEKRVFQVHFHTFPLLQHLGPKNGALHPVSFPPLSRKAAPWQAALHTDADRRDLWEIEEGSSLRRYEEKIKQMIIQGIKTHMKSMPGSKVQDSRAA